MLDPVDIGGTELYIQELEHHIDELESMVAWCIENEALILFNSGGVTITTENNGSIQPTILDAYHDLRDSSRSG